ncbi:MAG TPA: thiamine diphosphokinase [Acidimicrobiia bacterium]|nr:thiamine diphosphokinase [Acidimicrobiia bacterium]
METILIFAGGNCPTEGLSEELPEADLVVAADSGYDHAVGAGFRVDVLIGDLDSIQTDVLASHVIVERFPTDKDATDLELALTRVAAERPERVVVVGGGGGRVDHELAVASLLCSSRWAELEIDWVTDRGWAHVIHGRRIIHGDVGSLVSLVPMGGPAVGVSTKGLRWQLEDADLGFGTTRGVSNEFVAPVADVRLASGCLLAVIPSPG